jgi:hypothetical protein
LLFCEKVEHFSQSNGAPMAPRGFTLIIFTVWIYPDESDMLQCNMNQEHHLQRCLEDLLADIRQARGAEDPRRLVFLAYCEVRRWAREAGQPALADRVSEIVTGDAPNNRATFMHQIDNLIAELNELHQRLSCNQSDLQAQQLGRVTHHSPNEGAANDLSTVLGSNVA